MVAAHREMESLCVGIKAALDFSDSPPINFSWISVLLIASHHAAFAADALRHIEVKAILLAQLQRPLRNQRWRRQRRDCIQAVLILRRGNSGQQECNTVFSRPFDEWQ